MTLRDLSAESTRLAGWIRKGHRITHQDQMDALPGVKSAQGRNHRPAGCVSWNSESARATEAISWSLNCTKMEHMQTTSIRTLIWLSDNRTMKPSLFQNTTLDVEESLQRQHVSAPSKLIKRAKFDRISSLSNKAPASHPPSKSTVNLKLTPSRAPLSTALVRWTLYNPRSDEPRGFPASRRSRNLNCVAGCWVRAFVVAGFSQAGQ